MFVSGQEAEDTLGLMDLHPSSAPLLHAACALVCFKYSC